MVKDRGVRFDFEQSAERQHVDIVIPPDGRARFAAAPAAPLALIGQLLMTFPNGKTYSGTGTLIGSRFVLTAAHNLWGDNLGGAARSVTFKPGLCAPAAPPYGVAQGVRAHISEEYYHAAPPSPLSDPAGTVLDVTKFIYDYAVLEIDVDYRKLGAIGVVPVADSALAKLQPWIIGYPGDKPAGEMWGMSGPIQTFGEDLILYNQISTYGGQSGSSLLYQGSDNSWRTTGVHVGGWQEGPVNFAVRLNDERVDNILSWMSGAGRKLSSAHAAPSP